jgi:hypothetical protein
MFGLTLAFPVPDPWIRNLHVGITLLRLRIHG